MDYTAQAATGQTTLNQPRPELGRLKAASERVAVAAQKVDYFLTRFHGPRPENPSPPAGESLDSYRNDLDSLFYAIERLETATSALDTIG